MIELIKNLDEQILLFINQGMHNSVFDWLMPLMRKKENWIPVYIVMALSIILNFKKNSFLLIIACVISVLIADGIASGILKPIFERARPCNNLNLMSQLRLVIDCGGGYSFASSHAANHFALAIIFSYFFKEAKWLKYLLISWASLISFAQMYLAYHYPSDIVIGALIGIGSSCLIILFYRKRELEINNS
jgi:membrane-associated phospholipid phosphatase